MNGEKGLEVKKGISKNCIFWVIVFGITLLCMWKTQRAVPIMMDDEWYSTILSDDRPLASLGDIVQAQIWHYNHWGGRTVAHTIAQLIFLYLGEPVADVLNILLIVLLAWLINAMMGENRFAFVTLMIGFLHGLNANWKMSMYWQTGACNYLYTTVIILAFLWLYLRALEEEEIAPRARHRLHLGTRDTGAETSGSAEKITGGKGGRNLGKKAADRVDGSAGKTLPGMLLWASVLGLLSGWTNENMGPAVWVMTILVILYSKYAGKPVKAWMIFGSAFCLLGSLLMILAPGNAVRSAEVASNSYGTLWQTFLRMYGVCKGAWEYLFPVLFMTMALLFVNVCILGNSLNIKEVLLLVGALLSWGAMVLSPHYPDRASFGTMCLLLCVCVSQAAAVLKSKDNKLCRISMAGIGLFVWLRGMYFLGEFLAICWGWIR